MFAFFAKMAASNFDLGDLEDSEDFGSETTTVEAVEPRAKVAATCRFGEKSLSDVAELIDNRVPSSTKRTTDGWVMVFTDFCKEQKNSMNLRDVQPQALVLCYANARTRDGNTYQKPSLLGLRSATFRKLGQT